MAKRLQRVSTRPKKPAAYTATMLPAQNTGYTGNSGRGQYLWYPTDHPNPVPASLGNEVQDVYARMAWREVELTRGVYNWSAIDSYIATATARGGRFGTRLMPFCQGVANCLPDDVKNLPSTWQITLDGIVSFVPDWNDAAYLARWREIMQAIAARYDDNPRFYSIDVGGYGNWGEGHNYPYESHYPGPTGQTQGTVASLQAIIRAACDSFHNTFIYYNPITVTDNNANSVADSAILVQYALNYSLKLNIRTDAFGGGHIQDMTRLVVDAAQRNALAANIPLQNQPLGRWQIAPSTAEWSGYVGPGTVDGSFAEGAAQVETWHTSLISNANFVGDNNGYADFSAAEKIAFDETMRKAGFIYAVTDVSCAVTGQNIAISASWVNNGFSPTYDTWTVTYRLHATDGSIIAAADSPLNLKTVYTKNTRVVDSITIASPMALTGMELLSVIITPQNGIISPMQLACGTHRADGSHVLGSLADRAVIPPYVPPSVHNMVLLHDDFTGPLYKWSQNSAATISGGQLLIAASVTYPAIQTYERLDFREATLTVNVTQALPATGSYESSVHIMYDSKNELILTRTVSGMAALLKTDGTTAAMQLPGFTATYAWWRVRQTGGKFYFDFSTDGVAWVTLGQTSCTWSTQFVYILLQAGNWAAEPSASMSIDTVEVKTL